MSTFSNVILNSIIIDKDDEKEEILEKKYETLKDSISLIKALSGDEEQKQLIIKTIKEKKDWRVDNMFETGTGNSLLMVCIENMYNGENLHLAGDIVENKMYDPSLLNGNKENAIMFICRSLIGTEADEYTDYVAYLATKIIEHDSSSISQVDISGNTALINACKMAGRPELVHAMIQTGKSIPEHVDNKGDTALIIACRTKKENKAMQILRTGKVDPFYVNPQTNKSAVDFARQNKLTNVLDEISATRGLGVASAIQLRTTEADANKPIEQRMGYRDEQELLNPSAPKDMEKHILSFLPKKGGKKTRKRRNRLSRKI